jgi:hypothetical protein
MTTGYAAAVADSQDGLQLGERKTDRQSPLNQFHALLRGRRVLAVVPGRSLRPRQEPEMLVVP